jgi:chromosome segregation ATPase
LAAESQRAQFEELVRQKEQLIAELEQQINSLSQDLEKEYQLHAGLQPSLDGIGERLESLEYAQNKINERMLQLVQRIHEMYENTGLLEVIKRSLGPYRRQDA